MARSLINLSSLLLLLTTGTQALASAIVANGDTRCDGGRDCNQCVHDVQSQFRGIRADPSGRFTQRSGAGLTFPGMPEPMLPLTLDGPSKERHSGHVQGINRLTGINDKTWIVASLNTKKKRLSGAPAGLMFYRLGDVSEDRPTIRLGAPLRDFNDADRYWVANQSPSGPKPHTDRRPRFFHRMPQTQHPGGFQTIGRIIAVASYCDGADRTRCTGWNQGGDTPPYWGDEAHAGHNAYVDFIEAVPIPNAPNSIRVNTLGRLLLGDVPPFWDFDLQQDKAFYLSIVKLATGHYLLMVNRSNKAHMQFFVSTTTRFDAAMDWTYHGKSDWSTPTYQNAYFVTECETQAIYWLGFLQPDYPKGDSWVDLYRVEADGQKVQVNYLENRRLASSDDACEGKSGAGVYVTPLGGMVLYCSQARSIEKGRTDQDPLLLNFSEFVAPHQPRCGDGYLSTREFCQSDLEAETSRETRY